MTKPGIEYFREELLQWFKTLDFCINEIPAFETRLIEVLRINNNPESASKVEVFLNEFAELHNKINLLQLEVKRLKNEFNGHHRNNGSVVVQGASPQDMLRENMQAVEKELVDAKYRCYQFLATEYKAT